MCPVVDDNHWDIAIAGHSKFFWCHDTYRFITAIIDDEDDFSASARYSVNDEVAKLILIPNAITLKLFPQSDNVFLWNVSYQS